MREGYGLDAQRSDIKRWAKAEGHRVVGLKREALLTRDARGCVTEIDWAGCIGRRSEEHTFTKSNVVTELVAPRGLDDVIAKLKKAKWQYAVTGSIAAQPRSPIARFAKR